MSGIYLWQAVCMLGQVWWNVICIYGRASVMECHAYVNTVMWLLLNQKQYIIKGMSHGMGVHLVHNKRDS